MAKARAKTQPKEQAVNVSAAHFIKTLKSYSSPDETKKISRTLKLDDGSRFIGVRMGQVFALAKAFVDAPLSEIEKLLDSDSHEARVGAVSIMDFQARGKKISETHRRELYELYLRRHDRIDNWDLVDRAAPYVIGGYLFDKPRDILYKLARSKNVWERRTAIVSTYYFIRQGDLDDTFNLAEVLLEDDHDLIHKAVGGWLRGAGKKDPKRLLKFLDQHASIMPRTMLRYAIEHLEEKQREHYLGLRKAD
jgi:3-methyladenine DNA glycosylase AlkD